MMSIRFFSFCSILFAVSAFALGTETYFEIIDNEGNSVFGTITALDRTQVTVDAEGVVHTLPLEKLSSIRNLAPSPYDDAPSAVIGNQNLRQQMPRALPRGQNDRRLAIENFRRQQSNELVSQKTFPGSVVVLELKDGSRLIASSFTVANNQGFFRLLEHQNDSILPLNTVSAVRFAVRNLLEVVNPPADWQRLAIPNAEGDRLIVGNPGSFDVYAGILNDISAETISFSIDGEVLPVPRRRVFGLVLHDEMPSVDAVPPLGILTLWTGTRGMISDIRLDGNELTWQTTSGLTAVVPLEMVDEIDFGGQGAVYLIDFELVRSEFSLPFESDISPAQLGFLQTFFESRTHNSSREAILDGISYRRSITLKGRTLLEYSLPKPFVSLRAVIGIEDQFRPHASVVLQILADSQVLGTWELRGDSVSERIHLNLPQNCRLITIIAEPSPRSNVPAVLTIAEPKLLEW